MKQTIFSIFFLTFTFSSFAQVKTAKDIVIQNVTKEELQKILEEKHQRAQLKTKMNEPFEPSQQNFSQSSSDVPIWRAQPNNNSIQLNWINDTFNPNPTDRHMTNAVDIQFETDQIPYWLDDVYQDYDRRIMIGLSQYMYTPQNIRSTELQKEDRPYAGWLYSRFEMRAQKGHQANVIGFEAGMVGPHSYAEQAQYGIHQVIDAPLPRGWQYQVGDEPGVNAFYKKLYSFRNDYNNFAYEAIPYAEVKVGNVSTYGEVGSTFRAGYNMPDDMGLGTSDQVKPIGIYLFANVSAKAVARDIFLDGNSFKESIHTVDKENYVATVAGGLVVQIYNVKIGYMIKSSSEEFKGQKGNDVNGTFMIVYTKKF